jgi:hypothetical protein
MADEQFHMPGCYGLLGMCKDGQLVDFTVQSGQVITGQLD